jgi:UDP-GlcNAc:undecaprenyl-phosphate GlcNAc-1-phosphate transferase
MTKWISIAEVFTCAAIISYLVMPFLRIIALKTGYFDNPENTKVHAHPTPLLGGLGIYFAFMIGAAIKLDIIQDHRLSAIMSGCAILLLVGLIDDKMGMMPEIKLLGQFLAAMVVIKSGIKIEFLQNYYLNIILTYLWIIGITNSFNLLDNMNGLSSGIAAIAAIFFGVVMRGDDKLMTSLLCFSLAGACLGFLKHNFPKAKIFMGDAGSLIVGFALAALAILGSWSTRFLTTSLAMPIIILGYPIFDTALVIIMRTREGRSIFQGGRDHSSHRLALLGLKKKRAVLVIYCMCILLGLSAILIQRLPLRSATGVIMVIALLMISLGIRLGMVNTGRFGRNRKGEEFE